MKHITPAVAIFYSTVLLTTSLLVFVSSLDENKDLILTQSEKYAMDKFKSLVTRLPMEPFMRSDFYLLRWLRKANSDVNEAYRLLSENIAWRAANNISNILNENWSDMYDEYPLGYEGHDKQGRPLLFFHLGGWEMRTAIFQGKQRRLQRYLTASTEQGMRKVIEAQQNGKNVTRLVAIVDVEGMNMYQHSCTSCLLILTKWGNERDTYYPDFTYQTILLHVSRVSALLLNVVKAQVNEKLRQEMIVFPVGDKRWMAYLDQRIDKDQRPIRYGGTKKSERFVAFN